MPLIVREGFDKYETLPRDWNEEWFEAHSSAAADGCSNASIAICGFRLPEQGFGLDTLNHLLQNKVLNSLSQRKEMYEKWLNAVPPVAHEGWSNEVKDVDDTIKWPVLTSNSVKNKFDSQPCPMMGTGFTFAKGLVMTNAHVAGSLLDARLNPVNHKLLPVVFDYSYYPVPTVSSNTGKPGGTSQHSIKRFVLMSDYSMADQAEVGFEDVIDNDLAIIELTMKDDKAKTDQSTSSAQKSSHSGEWPKILLKLDDQVVSNNPATGKQQVVYACGHPHGLPMKCIAWDRKTTEPKLKPTILAAPGPLRRRHEHTCINVDLSLAPGSSGSPLINHETQQVIGIARETISRREDFPNPRSVLASAFYTSYDAWVKQFFQEAGSSMDELPSTETKAMLCTFFDDMMYNPHFGPDAFHMPRVPVSIARKGPMAVCNRIDHIVPFTRPLSAFFNSVADGAVDVMLEIEVAAAPHGPQVELLHEVNGQWIRWPSMWPVGYRGESHVQSTSVYRWRRSCLSSQDLAPALKPTGNIQPGYADIPVSVLNQENGLCNWSKFKLVFLPTGKKIGHLGAARGKLAVHFDFGGMSDNAVSFAIEELEFHQLPRGVYEAYIGETVTSWDPIKTVGKAWKGPNRVSLDRSKLIPRTTPFRLFDLI